VRRRRRGTIRATVFEPDLIPDLDEAALPPLRRWWRSYSSRDAWGQAAVVLEAVVLAGCVLFVLAQLGPSLLLNTTTPTGGDMGAHVWGPAYLRDELLPSGRLAGWTPDWYAGFPAYHFYMVVPALAIVILDAGLSGWAALLPLAASLALLWVSLTHADRTVRRRALVAGLLVAAFGIGLPYAVAFKWVAVAGLLALPVCAYAAGRLAELPFPGPTMLALGSTLFIFNRQPIANGGTGNIIGGNFTSTMAGEFSFSISLAFMVLFLGFLLRGLRRGGYRATTALLLGLTALCHIIPAIYAVGLTLLAVLVSAPVTWARIRWLVPVGIVGVAVSAFWTGPFVLRRAYLNDMGWEKLPAGITEVPTRDLLWRFWWDDVTYGELRTSLLDTLAPDAIHWIMALAAVGLLVSVMLRIRLGVLLGLAAIGSAVGFVFAPQGRLWNARLLPMFLLAICLLGALALGELVRAVGILASREPSRRIGPGIVVGTGAVCVAAVLYLGLALNVLPGREATATGGVRWGFLEISADTRSHAAGWARHNFTGLESKAAYPELHSLISMMDEVGETEGCGRAMWEFESDRLDRYGTTMAPMLLPFFTDGCIGSMEGLFFEASASTPYHFLNQRALSPRCSCAQRDLPYGGGFDIDLGVQQLQMMGVRYYLAFSTTAVEAASDHPDLTEVASDDVWHVYLVADSDLVVPLEYEPAVLTDLDPGMSWVGPASKWFQDPTRWDVHLAEDGPDEWQRLPVEETAPETESVAYIPEWVHLDVAGEPELRELPSITVSDVSTGTDRIAFDVSEPGVPVLVRASYFPNWEVSGAEGPYRVSPNLMVVIPTDTHVELHYGWTPVDAGSYVVSALGIVGLVALSRRPRLLDGDDARLFLDGPEPDDDDELDEDDDEPSVDLDALPPPQVPPGRLERYWSEDPEDPEELDPENPDDDPDDDPDEPVAPA